LFISSSYIRDIVNEKKCIDDLNSHSIICENINYPLYNAFVSLMHDNKYIIFHCHFLQYIEKVKKEKRNSRQYNFKVTLHER